MEVARESVDFGPVRFDLDVGVSLVSFVEFYVERCQFQRAIEKMQN